MFLVEGRGFRPDCYRELSEAPTIAPDLFRLFRRFHVPRLFWSWLMVLAAGLG
jgi:hypothetical protein